MLFRAGPIAGASLATDHWPLATGRRGVTLTEALVAIFVCGIGLIALMTLFPLGALNMAQALRDDRAAHCAANATAVLRSVWRVSLENGQTDPAIEQALQRGPIYFDPIGLGNGFGGQINGAGIPRMSVAAINGNQAATIRWFTLLDDLQFKRDATPEGSPVQVRREGRFSWAYMIRRLKPDDPRALQFCVVVYQNRPVILSSASYLAPGEQAYPGAQFSVGQKTVTVNHGGNKPKLRKGGWIMDATPGPEQGFFYRAVSVKDTSANTVTIEVQTPFRFKTDKAGTLVVMENVIEVFERGTLE